MLIFVIAFLKRVKTINVLVETKPKRKTFTQLSLTTTLGIN